MALDGFKLASLSVLHVCGGDFMKNQSQTRAMNPTRAGVQQAIHHQSTSQPATSPRNADEETTAAWRGTRIMKLDTRLLPAQRTPV